MSKAIGHLKSKVKGDWIDMHRLFAHASLPYISIKRHPWIVATQSETLPHVLAVATIRFPLMLTELSLELYVF